MSEPTPRKRHYVIAEVIGNALAEANNEKRTPSVKVQLQAIPDRNPPTEEGIAPDRVLWADLWLTDAALGATLETLETAFGWLGMTIAELNEPILAGAVVSCACSWEEGTDGKWREKVDYINPPGGGGLKKLEADAAVQVVSKVDAMLARMRTNSPGAKAAKPAPRPARTAEYGASPPTRREREQSDEDFFA